MIIRLTCALYGKHGSVLFTKKVANQVGVRGKAVGIDADCQIVICMQLIYNSFSLCVKATEELHSNF